MLKLYIADDSALVRDRLRILIADLDFVELVGQASDAQQAIKEIQKLEPDVLILDIKMPEGNGSLVLEALDRSADEPKPVVIVLTAYPYPQYRRKYLTAGADYFFDKATEFERVVTVLEELMEGSSRPQKT